VSARAARDIELEAISRPTLDSARAALERKAKIYDKLKKGQSGGLNEAQYEALLVDVSVSGSHRACGLNLVYSLTVKKETGIALVVMMRTSL
jgi:hypothetical protein